MRRRQRYAVVLLAMVLLATACGGGDDKSDESASQQTTAPANQELTVGVTADQFVVSGPRANLGSGFNIAETLLLLTPNYEVKPLLAERYEFRPPNTWASSSARA